MAIHLETTTDGISPFLLGIIEAQNEGMTRRYYSSTQLSTNPIDMTFRTVVKSPKVLFDFECRPNLLSFCFHLSPEP